MYMPEWLDDCLMNVTKEIADIYYQNVNQTDEIKRLYVGPTIRTLLENMDRSELHNSSVKIHLYSGEDSTVTVFTRVHGATAPAFYNYGSAVFIEKLKDPKTSKSYIRVS